MTAPLPHYFTTEEVATALRLKPRKVREVALSIGVGIAGKGRAGYRFTAEDVKALTEEMRPAAPVAARRRRRAS